MSNKYSYFFKGYLYAPYEETEFDDDNTKIYHDVVTPEGKTIHFDWSPYSYPTLQDFKLWIELGTPDRISGGTLDRKDLDTIQDRTIHL